MERVRKSLRVAALFLFSAILAAFGATILAQMSIVGTSDTETIRPSVLVIAILTLVFYWVMSRPVWKAK